MVISVERWIKKQLERVRVAEDEYKAGIESVTENPCAKAAEKADKYLKRIEERVEYWKTRLSKISLEEWKRRTLEKARRFPEGVRAAEDRIREFVRNWQPILADIQAAVRAMPDLTDADREKRMIENLRRLKAAKGTWMR